MVGKWRVGEGREALKFSSSLSLIKLAFKMDSISIMISMNVLAEVRRLSKVTEVPEN